MQPTDRSSPILLANDEVVTAIAEAMLAGNAQAENAWHHAGVICANHLIEFHPERVNAELAEADTEWDIPARMGKRWLGLVAGYRDTLREYTERGND